MRSFKLLLGAGLLLLPLWLHTVPASAQVPDSEELIEEVEQAPPANQTCLYSEPDVDDMCDVGLDKQVSVNGGVFTAADSESTAAAASIGDTVTWQITVTSFSSGDYLPYATLVIEDLLPSGVTFESFTVSEGTFDSATMEWVLPTATSSGGEFPEYTTTLPATLTLTTTATTTGTWENIANLRGWWCDGDYECKYQDMDDSNDLNSAFVVVATSSTPQVLGETTGEPQVLAATGTQTVLFVSATGLLIILSTVLLHTTLTKKS